MKASTTCVKAFDAQDSQDREFLSWLRANGAQFELLEWPSRNTERNVRGATARKEISTEVSVIGIKLEKYRFHCFYLPTPKATENSQHVVTPRPSR